MFLKISPKLTIFRCYSLRKMAIFATFRRLGVLSYAFGTLEFNRKEAIYVLKPHIINRDCRKLQEMIEDMLLCVFDPICFYFIFDGRITRTHTCVSTPTRPRTEQNYEETTEPSIL